MIYEAVSTIGPSTNRQLAIANRQILLKVGEPEKHKAVDVWAIGQMFLKDGEHSGSCWGVAQYAITDQLYASIVLHIFRCYCSLHYKLQIASYVDCLLMITY